MAGTKLVLEDSELFPPRAPQAAGSALEMVSDDDRSVAADSWSVKSDYGSTMDDEQRHVDAAEVLSSCSFPNASDNSSDKVFLNENEADSSMLGSESYWSDIYAEHLANFQKHGQAGQVWFGVEAMIAVCWIKNLCVALSHGHKQGIDNSSISQSGNPHMSSWSVLDIGTGNGLLLQELAKQGFTDMTGIDFSEAAIELAQNLAVHNGHSSINFLVDDVLNTKLSRSFKLVVDKGTLDCVWLHPDGQTKRMTYWKTLSKLVAPGGILVVTSCDHTRGELVHDMESFNQQRKGEKSQLVVFEYLDHLETRSQEPSPATVAFLRKMAKTFIAEEHEASS